jgi:hypothetical protein
MEFSRYMDVRAFIRELEPLRAFGNEYIGPNLLESLEETGLLWPRLRVRYPDPIARRFWLIQHEDIKPPYELDLPQEPDGPQWDAAVALSDALYKWQHFTAYGLTPNPLDDPDPRFDQFIERPAQGPFVPWHDRRVDISNNHHRPLFDDQNVESYYTTWQVLLAAEVADAGIHGRMNLADVDAGQVFKSLSEGKAPAARWSINFSPVHAARDFSKHEKSLDAVVWFAEERSRALIHIIKDQGGGRFKMSAAQSEQYSQATNDAAQAAMQRYGISVDDLIELIRFLTERWVKWDREGRPRIADAYKAFLASVVILTRLQGKLSFKDVRDRIGQVGGWVKPILDMIWPNWAEEEKDRVRRTLKAALSSSKADAVAVADPDIDAFVEFLASEGLEAFFWRLKSFEDHAFRGNEFALEGMRSDLQGMALAVEHVAVALGATETQLYEKFKQLWRDPDVLSILKRGTVAPLARQERLAHDWPALKSKIDALRSEKGGRIAADLVMAHRIRGGVHTILPEDDQFALEALLVALMRAAIHTFIEVRQGTPQPRANS